MTETTNEKDVFKMKTSPTFEIYPNRDLVRRSYMTEVRLYGVFQCLKKKIRMGVETSDGPAYAKKFIYAIGGKSNYGV